jgi:FtsZ-interacting cell division protein YlmF
MSSSPLNKVMGFLGLVDTEADQQVAEVGTREVTSIRERTGSTAGVTVVGRETVTEQDASTTYNIVTLQPRSYSEARKVGEFYRQGHPVIINLDDMEESERKRLVDFSSGLVFGLHGRIERISLKVFLLSPANVNVSNEDKSAAQATFFNQS